MMAQGPAAWRSRTTIVDGGDWRPGGMSGPALPWRERAFGLGAGILEHGSRARIPCTVSPDIGISGESRRRPQHRATGSYVTKGNRLDRRRQA